MGSSGIFKDVLCAIFRIVHDLEGKLWASFEYSIFSQRITGIYVR